LICFIKVQTWLQGVIDVSVGGLGGWGGSRIFSHVIEILRISYLKTNLV